MATDKVPQDLESKIDVFDIRTKAEGIMQKHKDKGKAEIHKLIMPDLVPILYNIVRLAKDEKSHFDAVEVFKSLKLRDFIYTYVSQDYRHQQVSCDKEKIMVFLAGVRFGKENRIDFQFDFLKKFGRIEIDDDCDDDC